MDEDIPPANDSLSYADDVPYETQLPDLMEQETAASLKKRIGNRIYLLEDSLSKKVRTKIVWVYRQHLINYLL